MKKLLSEQARLGHSMKTKKAAMSAKLGQACGYAEGGLVQDAAKALASRAKVIDQAVDNAAAPKAAPSLAAAPAPTPQQVEAAKNAAVGIHIPPPPPAAPAPTTWDKFRGKLGFAFGGEAEPWAVGAMGGGYNPLGSVLQPNAKMAIGTTERQLADNAAFTADLDKRLANRFGTGSPATPQPIQSATPMAQTSMVTADPTKPVMPQQRASGWTYQNGRIAMKRGGQAWYPGQEIGSYAQGGFVPGGGHVKGPGGPKDDKVPAMLSNGEYVLPVETKQALGGKPVLDHLVEQTTGRPPVNAGVTDPLDRKPKNIVPPVQFNDTVGYFAHGGLGTSYINPRFGTAAPMSVPMKGDGGYVSPEITPAGVARMAVGGTAVVPYDPVKAQQFIPPNPQPEPFRPTGPADPLGEYGSNPDPYAEYGQGKPSAKSTSSVAPPKDGIPFEPTKFGAAKQVASDIIDPRVGGKAMKFVKGLGWVAAAAPEAMDIYKVATDPTKTKTDVATQVAEGAGRFGASMAGAGAGAAVGSAILPVVGTTIGGIAGGLAGYYGADKAIQAGREAVGVNPTSPAKREAAGKITTQPGTKPEVKPMFGEGTYDARDLRPAANEHIANPGHLPAETIAALTAQGAGKLNVDPALIKTAPMSEADRQAIRDAGGFRNARVNGPVNLSTPQAAIFGSSSKNNGRIDTFTGTSTGMAPPEKTGVTFGIRPGEVEAYRAQQAMASTIGQAPSYTAPSMTNAHAAAMQRVNEISDRLAKYGGSMSRPERNGMLAALEAAKANVVPHEAAYRTATEQANNAYHGAVQNYNQRLGYAAQMQGNALNAQTQRAQIEMEHSKSMNSLASDMIKANVDHYKLTNEAEQRNVERSTKTITDYAATQFQDKEQASRFAAIMGSLLEGTKFDGGKLWYQLSPEQLHTELRGKASVAAKLALASQDANSSLMRYLRGAAMTPGNTQEPPVELKGMEGFLSALQSGQSPWSAALNRQIGYKGGNVAIPASALGTVAEVQYGVK